MSLSSLIVQREIATIRQVEEALARQVLYGGDLVTNLLEVAGVDENKLSIVAAQAAGIESAPGGLLPTPEQRARSLIPADLAMRRSIYPLTMTPDNEQLVLVVSEPLATEEEDQLMFALGVPITQRLAPLVRIREALAREYGVPLERRFERLLARLRGDATSFTSSLPPMLRGAPAVVIPPRPATVPPRTGSDPTIRAAQIAGPKRTQTRNAFPAPDPALAFAHETPTDVMRLPPVVERFSAGPGALTPKQGSVPSGLGAPPATLVRDTGASLRPARRRRGPLTADTARGELEDVVDRDALLDLYFDFSRQYFEYAALFIVHGDIAEGRDAFGTGASRETVAGIGVPLDLPLPGILARARDTKNPVWAVPSREGIDPVLLADLDRKIVTSDVIVVPLVVRGRVVALLYGDAGDVGVDRDAVADVVQFAVFAGQSFERLILRKKLGDSSAGTKATSAGRSDPGQLVRKRQSGRSESVPVDRSARAEALGRALFTGASVSAADRTNPVEPARSGRAESVSPPDRIITDPDDDDDEIQGKFTVPRKRLHVSGVQAPPPPATAVAVHRPSGPPIPRDDPMDATSRPPERFSQPPPAGVGRSPAPGRVSQPVPDLVVEEPDNLASRELLAEIEDAPAESTPPPSQTVVVAARLPPSSRTDGEALPSIIVDVSRELEVLVARFIADVNDEAAEAELIHQGQHAMPAIMARFPGPILMEPKPQDEDMPAVSACGPLLRLIAAQRRVALPSILPYVDDHEEARRFWATFLLSELAYPEALPSLIERLSDQSDRVRCVARIAAASMAKSHGEEVAREIGRIARDTRVERGRRLEMLAVLEEIREPLAVPTFISVLGDHDEDIAVAARRALLVVTRQDFGRDARRWTTWWNQNSSGDRIEWLIDALVHDVQGIRRAAGEELKAITKEYFGYYDDLPRRDRERAQLRYREWWTHEGHLKFTRQGT
jgi:Type II secretion system (T2SS), protein E, N-terminal domain